jgi:hypothetical protein
MCAHAGKVLDNLDDGFEVNVHSVGANVSVGVASVLFRAANKGKKSALSWTAAATEGILTAQQTVCLCPG